MKRCEKCGGANTVQIAFRESNRLVAVPYVQRNKILPKYSRVAATACSDCGAIFDLKLEKPEVFQPFVGFDV